MSETYEASRREIGWALGVVCSAGGMVISGLAHAIGRNYAAAGILIGSGACMGLSLKNYDVASRPVWQAEHATVTSEYMYYDGMYIPLQPYDGSGIA